jgi:CDP-diacylglycerol--glycerol-3-phosphate 3-phosphatidyltransferase
MKGMEDFMSKSSFLNLPNWITIGRLIAVPFLMVLMLFIDDAGPHRVLSQVCSLVAAGLFVLAMLSDILDGWLARRQGLSSTFGSFLDPLADKMLFITAMIMMVGLSRLPAWIAALFFMREVMVTALRGIAADEGIVIAASHWGKYKSAFVSCATVGLLVHYPFFGIHWKLIGWVLLIPSIVLSVASGLQYTIGFFREMLRREAVS